MSGLIDRIQDRATTTSQRARVLEMTEGDADEVLDALASDTGRATFQALFEEPRTPSEIADRVDTSVQNVHYHLSKLQAAGVVESVGTRLSEKGNEMTVYGPAADPIVLVGDASPTRRDDLRRAVSEWAAGVAVLGLTSLAVQVAADRLLGSASSSLFEPASLGVGEGALLRGIELVAEPGVLFFLGGLVVFVAAALRGGSAPIDD